MKIFSGSASKHLAQHIADQMGESLSPLELFVFSDGERRIRILEDVVDQDVAIVQSTATPADMNYMELFFIADGLRRSGARSITVVIPYVGYQRQDHVFRDGEAVSLEVIVRTLEAVGVDKVVTLDLHSVRILEVFKMPVAHLSALPLFAKVIRDNGWNHEDTVLVSPDMGGVRRIKKLSELLDNMKYHAVKKQRNLDTGEVESVHFEDLSEVSEVELGGKTAIIVDDIITSGTTIVKAAQLLKEKGIEKVIVFATHAILASGASMVLEGSPVDKVYVTDTVLVPEVKKVPKMEVLSVAELVAEELKKI